MTEEQKSALSKTLTQIIFDLGEARTALGDDQEDIFLDHVEDAVKGIPDLLPVVNMIQERADAEQG